MPSEFTYAGTTYTRQPDGQYLNGKTGKPISAMAAQSLYDLTSDDGNSKTTFRETDVPGIVFGSDGRYYEDGRAITSAQYRDEVKRQQGAENPRQPDSNLGAGVFEDERGYYVWDDPQTDSGLGVTTSGKKRYITEAEARNITDPKTSQPSATESGNLSARWAELNQRQMEADREYQLRLQENAAALAQAQVEMDFLREKETFAQSQDKTRLALETQGQIFNQQTTMVTLAQQRQEMEFSYAVQQAQLQAEADQFNASMGFNVAQANQQAAAQKRGELAQNSRDVASFSESPTDWGAAASFQLANSEWGQQDASMQPGQFITDRSLQPLAGGLDNRDRILASPDNPYSFNPVQAPMLPALGASPDLSFLNNFGTMQGGQSGGMVNEQDSNLMGRGGIADTDQRTGEFIPRAAGGDPLWVGPDPFAGLPKKEDGGLEIGAFIAGDSKDGKENQEVVIPDYPVQGMTTIIPKDKITAQMRKHMTKYATGGIFDPLDTTKARQFQTEAASRARIGTPWETGQLPGATFASSPTVRGTAVEQLLASLRGVEYGEDPNFFMQRAQRLAPASMQERAIGRTA